MIKYERYKANTTCGRTYNGGNDLETLCEKRLTRLNTAMPIAVAYGLKTDN